MSQDYNSELIHKLYNSQSSDEAVKILNEIEEIKDPIFIYPIYDAFCKYKETAQSHYFISTLNSIDSNETLKIAYKIIDEATKQTHFLWALPILTKYKSFNEKYIQVCHKLIDNLANNKNGWNIEYYDIENILNFLYQANKISDENNNLYLILNNQTYDKDLKNTVLRFLLKNSNGTFSYLFENYKNFDNELQILISKQIIYWKGSPAEKLQNLIRNSGSPRAKEIITEHDKKLETDKQKEDESKKQQEIEAYGNTKIVLEISDLRTNVNYLALANEKLKIALFANSENLISQIKTVKDQASLVEACMNLRPVILNINDDITIPDSIDKTTLNTLLPGLKKEELNKSLNKLCVFLHLNGIKIDSSIYGIRDVNQIVCLVGAHNNEVKELIKILKKQNLSDDYSNKNWGLLHQKILQIYKDCLVKMTNSLK
jgi:hypothetical protein